MAKTLQGLFLRDSLVLGVSVDHDVESRLLEKERSINSLYKMGDGEWERETLKLTRSRDNLLWQANLRVTSLKDALECVLQKPSLQEESYCWVEVTQALQLLQRDSELLVRLATLEPSALPGMKGHSVGGFSYYVGTFSMMSNSVVGGILGKSTIKRR
jgi:hypothetical protein